MQQITEKLFWYGFENQGKEVSATAMESQGDSTPENYKPFHNKIMVIQPAISTSKENSRILAVNSAQLEEMKIAMQKTHEVASGTKTK